VPLVYDAHESFPDMLEGSIHPLLKRTLISLENFFLSRVDLLITVGAKLQQYFIDRGARRSVVIGNWKSLREYSQTHAQNAAVRLRLSIPTGALVVVCITQLFKDRKIAELLDAIDASPGTYLILGGKGSLEPLVRERAAANSRIKFVGFVTAEDIPAYTCASDIVYYGFDPANPNSRFSAPNKLFEALAAGRPLITGDFGEIADVVRKAACGIVLDQYSAEHIKAALAQLQDPAIRAAMAENALLFGRREMNSDKIAEILDREYSRLLSNTASAQPAVVGAGARSEIE
jgi:glycosyltransferase involved in cell wall biosynthesis